MQFYVETLMSILPTEGKLIFILVSLANNNILCVQEGVTHFN